MLVTAHRLCSICVKHAGSLFTCLLQNWLTHVPSLLIITNINWVPFFHYARNSKTQVHPHYRIHSFHISCSRSSNQTITWNQIMEVSWTLNVKDWDLGCLKADKLKAIQYYEHQNSCNNVLKLYLFIISSLFFVFPRKKGAVTFFSQKVIKQKSFLAT